MVKTVVEHAGKTVEFNQLSEPATSSTRSGHNFPVFSPVNSEWAEKAAEYLTGHGWRQAGYDEMGRMVWEDPRCNEPRAGVLTVTKRYRNKDDVEETLRQMVCPPIGWSCSTDVAMIRQRERDNNPETLEAAIIRKKVELERLVQEQQRQTRLAEQQARQDEVTA